MLHLYDLEHRKVKGLDKYKDFYIESTLSTGDKVLSFLYPLNLATDIKEESYIRTRDNEFVVKELNIQGSWQVVTATLNVEDLEGKEWEHFDTTEQTIQQCISLALAGTGWTIGTCNVTRRRTVRKTNCNSWDIIQEAKKRYRVEIEFDALNKKVNIAEKLGSDKGVYFSDSLNIKNLNIQRNSYDFYTRIIAKGKDELKVTLENFQYSNKIKTLIWKDERYTDINSLKEDAKAKLEELSKPYRAYAAEILDLAKISDKYKDILDYKLGDTITLLSKSNGIREKQRIVKIREYPEEPSRNTCEIANTTLRFEDIQKELEDTTETVNNITTDNGTIDGSTVDDIKTEQISDFEVRVAKITNLEVINASIKNLQVDKADINSLHAVEAKIGTIEATYAKITDLNVVNANIENLKVGKADITQLNAVSAKVNVLEASTAEIKTLVAGNITAENIQSNFLQVLQGWMLEGSIGNAQISDLNANKIRSGTIDTSLVTVAGPGGRLQLSGNKLQVFDSKNGTLYERIMLGIDSNNNSSLTLRGADGNTVLLTQDGLTKAGFTDGYNKIDNGSLDGVKLDINSVIRSVNGATEKIESTVVNVENKTLNVLLQEQTNTITEHGKSLSTQEARITANESAIRLKVDNQTYTTDKTTINKSIETTLATSKTYADTKKNEAISAASTDATTKANEAKTTAAGDATSKANAAKDSAINTASADATSKANSAKDTAIAEAQKKADKALADSKVYVNQEITTVNSSLSKATSDISVLKGQIALKVEQSDIDKTVTTVKNELVTKIDEIEVGGRNLLLDGKFNYYTTYNMIVNYNSSRSIVFKWNKSYTGTTFTMSNNGFKPKGFHTISGFIKVNGEIPKDKYFKDFASTYGDNLKENYYNSNTGYFKITQNYNRDSIWILHGYTTRLSGSEDLVELIDLKFEKGTEATDYTPAPEDIDKSIADVITTTDTKIVNAKTEIKAETDKINLNVSNLVTKTSTIETQLGDKATKSEVKSVSDKAATIEANLNAITQRVSSTESNISTVTSTVNTALSNANKGISDAKAASDKAVDAQNSANQAENLAKAMNQGKMLYTDPNFRQGVNNVSLYNNANNGAVAINRLEKTSDCPSTSTHFLVIKHTNTASPNHGGFVQVINSRANAVFIQKFIAKIPIGYYVSRHSNSMGTGYSDKWLTSDKGTGKWETYIREVRCGDSGTFSNGGHIALGGNPIPTPNSPVIWCLAYCTCFDITDNDESINTLTTEINTTNSKVAEIKATTDSISSRVSNVESTTATINGQVTNQETRLRTAESKITSTSIINTVATEFYRKGESDNRFASQTQISQLDNKISSKVDVNGVKSVIEQNPSSVKIGFNKITDAVVIERYGMTFNETNAKPATQIYGRSLYFYDWDKTDTKICKYGCNYAEENSNFKGMSMMMHDAKHLSLGLYDPSTGKDIAWVQLNNGRYVGDSRRKDVNFYRETVFSSNSHFDRDVLLRYNTPIYMYSNDLGAGYRGKIGMTTGEEPFVASNFEANKALNLGGLGWGSLSTSLACKTWGIQVYGTIEATGAKNRIVDTRYGTTKLNALETADCLFADVGEGKTDDNGICYIFTDKILQETLNTKHSYQVFISVYGDTAEQWVKCSERHEDYFVVKGFPNTCFAWEIKAKQKGYEMERLEFTERIKSNKDYISNMYEPKVEDLNQKGEDYFLNYKDKIMDNSQSYLKKYDKEILGGI